MIPVDLGVPPPLLVTQGMDEGLAATPGYDDVTGAGIPAPGCLPPAAARPDTRRRERAWRQPDVTGERVTIVAAGKCVAACRRAVLRWARRGKNVLCIRKEVLRAPSIQHRD